MEKEISKYRLRSSAFVRADDEKKIQPKKMIILSVEGDDTERTYFEHLNEHLDNMVIQIEVLRHRHGDGYSDPKYVLELLKEYLIVRDGEIIPDELIQKFIKNYPENELKDYINGSSALTKQKQKKIKEELMKLGIDLEYRRYLKSFRSDEDYFAVVLDRDCHSHSRELMQKCVKWCQEKNCGCFVSNPCFEFWLLLHLCEVKTEFSKEELKEFLVNKSISNNHTKVSDEVSKRANHKKKISEKIFNEHYFPHINEAIERAKDFATDFPRLFDELGSNIPELLREIGYT